jgi:hypothetical protein
MREERYPEITSHQGEVDVVIPFWERDRHLAPEAYASILEQVHCTCHIHLVADGCKPIDTQQHPRHHTYHYTTPGKWGPFRITNELIDYYKTERLAILDADDLAFDDRLAKQLAILGSGFRMTTGAMAQVAIENYAGARVIQNPVIIPGIKYQSTPQGRVINSTRTIHMSLFEEVNGFDWCLKSGDFQFDNRVLHVRPAYEVHYSTEMVGIRRMRPSSLSNNGESVAWKLMDIIKHMQENPTLTMARVYGMLDLNRGGIVLTEKKQAAH